MTRFLRALLVVLFLALAAGGGVAAWAYAQFVRPGPLPAPVAVLIPKGTGVEGVARRLAAAGVVADPRIFHLGVRMFGHDRPLQAGEFEFPAGISPREAMALLQTARTVVRRLTVAEGLTSRQVLDLVSSAEGLEGSIGAPPPEGALLPETYHFSFGDERAQVVARMEEAMAQALAELWDKRAPNLPLATPREALILASIVEKETGLAQERPRIAAVFINRLRKGMRLQSDPTVVYALTQGEKALGRALTRADWKADSPFNTYQVTGLPPAPICNPGRDAIAAVLNPAQTSELFFVADGTGGHRFATTLKEHNRNVARWRKTRRQQAQ